MRKILIFLLCLLFPVTAWGATFTWDHNTEPDLLGYKIYGGTDSRNYLYLVADVSKNINVITVETPGGQWYFAITAYDTEGLESDYSNEVLLAEYYYNSIKYDYDTGPFQNLLYRGENTRHDAGEADVDWVVTKYYYDTNGLMIGVRIRTTSWTNRAVGW